MLNVETLKDIAQSQLIVHGNKKLFIRDNTANLEKFSLLAGESSDIAFFECVMKDESCIDENGLEVLIERLNDHDDHDVIFCSDDDSVIAGFQLGFKSCDEGFIETIDSNELAQPTIIVG